MRRILLVLSMLWLSGAHAALSPELADLDSLPLHAASSSMTAKAIDEARARKGAGPAIFAVTTALPVDLDGGVWDEPTAGVARWRTRVFSAQAQALLMRFDSFELPSSAKLWIYDAQARVVQGPYVGAAHNSKSEVWTATVPGDTAVIELRVDTRERSRVALGLGRLGHAFKNDRDLGDSGACNINTACPLGNDWRNEIRSAVKLQIPAGAFVGVCSGTLINNLAQDDTPYILTADHCGIGNQGSAPSGVVVYWNFQNSGCNTLNAPDAQNQTGTILRARDEPTDLSLIELQQPPSAAFNVYFAGWDASGAGGNSGVSIHHPSGDAKKISEYTGALIQNTVNIGGSDIPAWQVIWNQGTTEQGSSGSGIWNQNRQIVGVLSGGSAACSGSADNDQPDFYARMERQWLANPQAAGQLKVWLDPANTGQRQVSGKNAASTPNPTPTPQPTPTPTPLPTATPTPNDSGGGGGSLGWPLLTLLSGLGLLRRRRE
jgi:lysyl endopeptidase